MRILAAVLALSLAACPSAFPAPTTELHVAPTGSDENPGSMERPFATIGRARDEVRKLVAAGLEADVLVSIHGGRYELAGPLVLGPQDSGTDKFSITYSAAPGEKPLISGGRRIVGWKRGPGEVWTAPVPSLDGKRWTFRQLFVGGERRTRARTPNAGFYRIEGPSSQDKPFKLKFRAGDIKKSWAAEDDVEVVAMLAWAEIRMPIREVDEGARIATLSGDPRDSNREVNAQYYIENAPDGLDAPGEWRIDEKAGIVSYWPLPGEDMTAAEAVAPALHELVRLDGDPAAGKPIRRIQFHGLSFAHTDWTLDKKGYADTQASVAIGGALKATGAIGCAVEGCSFSRLGGYAIEFGRGAQGNRIAGNELFDLAAGGVRIGDTAMHGAEAEQSSGNTVTDNHIHDLGKVYHAAVGVWVGQSSRNVISHNDIHDLFYTAVSVGWTWGYGPNQCKGNTIEWNHLHHLGKDLLSDMGGIYTLGVQPGTVIRRNLIHDVSAFTYGGWGIYPDEGSSEMVIEDNIVYRCKSALFHQHYGRENLVRNNIFAFGRESQLMRTRAEPHVSFTMERNIVYWKEGSLLGSNWSDDKYKLDRNVYFRAPGGEVRFGNWSFEEWKRRGQDVNSLIADPLFVDPEKCEFTLKPDSPALKLGFRPLDLRNAGPRGAGARE